MSNLSNLNAFSGIVKGLCDNNSGDNTNILRKLEYTKIYDSATDSERLVTQDDIDNYLLYGPVSIGKEIDIIYELNITKNELINYGIIPYFEAISREDLDTTHRDNYIRSFVESFSLIGADGDDKTNLIISIDGMNFSAVHNVNLRCYVFSEEPTPSPT